MNRTILDLIYRFRRVILKRIVPEFIWPISVQMDGAEIPVRGMPYSFGVKRTLSKGIYEDSERCLIKEIIRKGDNIIEFGGSIGIMAAIMSEIVGRDGHIVSVEASGRLAAHSKDWLEPKGNVKIVSGIGYPVWEAPSRFHNIDFIDDGNSLGGRVDFHSNGSSHNDFDIFDLKKLISMYDIEPNHLVIDIEGSEIIYLEEGIEIPITIQNIVIEMHPDLYGQKTEEAIIYRLEQLGFRMMKEVHHVYLLSRNR